MTILTSVMMFALLPLQGMGQGAQPITSYNFGAGKADRVKESFKVLVKNSFSYTAIIWLLIMIFPQVFARIFTPDQDLVVFTSWALRIYGAGIIAMGIQIGCQMTFVGIGSAKVSILVAVFRKFIMLIPLIYILPNFFADKVFAVYLAEPVADFTAVVFTVILFRIHFKKAMEKIEGK